MNFRGVWVVSLFPFASQRAILFLFLICAARVHGGEAILDDRMGSLGRDQRVAMGAEWRFAQNAQLEIVEINPPGDLPIKGFKMTGRNPYPTFAGIFDAGSGDDAGGGTGLTLGGKNGNSLELTVDFRFEKETSPGAEMRIGLFNNRGSPAVGDNWQLYRDDVGYWISIPVIGGLVQVFKELGSDGTIAGGSDKVLLKGTPGKIVLPLKDGWHTLSMTIARTDKGLMITGKLDGAVIGSGVDTPEPDDKKDPAGVYTVFHELGICTGPPKDTQLYLRRVQLHRDGAPDAGESRPPGKTGGPGAEGGAGAPKSFSWTTAAVGVGGLIAGVAGTWLFVRRQGG